jgi:hypothetical protein
MSLYFSMAVWSSLALAGFGFGEAPVAALPRACPTGASDAAAGCGEGAVLLKILEAGAQG